MRFVSHIRNLQLILIPTAARFTNYGDRIVDRQGYVARFTQDDVTDADVEFAEKEFPNIRGRTTEMDEITLTPLLSRISTFDTDERAIAEHWTDDFKEEAEAKLKAGAEVSDDFSLIKEIPVEPPWPAYMDFDGPLEELLDKIAADGHDFARVLAFERQLPAKRPILIEALEQKVAEQAELVRNVETVSA